MIHEYALESKLVATWADRHAGRYFIDKFGLDQPRIVSRYPRPWKKLVWQAFRSKNDIERKRMEVLLARLSEAMVRRRDARWNPGAAWLDNAEDEHGRVPFHAILARDNPREHGRVLVAGDFDDTTPLWEGRRGRSVSRSATALAAAVAVAAMLRNAAVVVLVDPHFGPENRRHREALRAFLRVAIDARPGALPHRIEVHCSADGGGQPRASSGVSAIAGSSVSFLAACVLTWFDCVSETGASACTTGTS